MAYSNLYVRELSGIAGRFQPSISLGKIIVKTLTLTLLAVTALALGACGNRTEQRIGGAAVGAGTGAVIAGPVGAVVGGAAGAISAPAVVRATR
jgi:osmotically inducible lipoprotein OsmB